MKLDFCTMMVKKAEWPFLPLQINSMKHHMEGYWNSFKISVPSDDQETIDYCASFGIDVLPHETYMQEDKSGGMKQDGYDTANRMDLLMKACTTDWVVLAHLDIIYTGPLAGLAQTHFNNNNGVIGFWPHGLTIVNRKAYSHMHYGFWPITCFEVEVLNEHHARLCGIDTPRENRETYGVLGIDTGEFITISMPVYGYRYLPAPLGSWTTFYFHVGGISYAPQNTPEEKASGIVAGIEERKHVALKTFDMFKG